MGLAELEQLVAEPEQKKPNITALEDLIAGEQASPADIPAAPQQITAEPEIGQPNVGALGGLTQRRPPSTSPQSRPMTDFEAMQFAGQPLAPTQFELRPTEPLSFEEQRARTQPIINRMLRKVQEDEDIKRQAQQLSQSVSFGIADELAARNEPGASGDIFGLGKLAARAREKFADLTQGPQSLYDLQVQARARQIRQEMPLSISKIAIKAPAFAADLANFIVELSIGGAVLKGIGLTVRGAAKFARILNTASKFGFHGFLKKMSEGESPGEALVTGAAPRAVLGAGLGAAGPTIPGQLIAGPAAFAGSAALETTIQGGSRREIAENAGYSGLFGLAFGVVNTLTPHAIGFLKRLKRTNPQEYNRQIRKASPRVRQFVESQPEPPPPIKPSITSIPAVRQASEAVRMAGFEPITASRAPTIAGKAPFRAGLQPTRAGLAPRAAGEAIKQSRAVAAEKLMPSINVYAKPKDAGLLQRTVLTLGNQIYNSGSKNVIAAGEDLLDTPMKMQDETRALLARDHTVMNKTVKKYSKRFFDWVEKPATPKQVRASRAIPADAKESVIHAKKTLEADRIEIRTRKRLMSAKIHGGQSIKDMQKAASDRGIKLEVRPRGPKGTKVRSLYDPSTQQFVTKEVAASRLAKIDIPDDWGKQWEYMPHMFFGKYKLGWYDASGKYRFIDRAETPAEATRKLKSFRELNPDIGAVRYEAKPDVFIPADMVRVSRGRYFHVVSEIQKAADLASKDITQGLRGTIGQKASKQKWAGFLQPRLGAKRYSKDFWKVWNLYRVHFQRWKYLSDLNRRVQPRIDAVKKEGLPLWADRLERDLDFVWGRYRSITSEGVDQMLQRLPIINRFAKPYALERYAGALKSINYMRHLQTPRFYALNSMQVFQTLNPIVGERQLAKGARLYYSKAGKQILTRHNITDPAGKLHERWMLRHGKWERYLPASASEIRNQSISFLTMYDHAQKLGLNDAAAARYGRLRGQLFTQFRYSPADIPPIMRGPISGLMLQYKRFPIKNLEILGRLVRDHKIGGVGRWVLAQGALGGTRMFVRSIPIAGTGYLTFKMYKDTEKDYGKDTADLIHYGLPALIGGVDMSGSVNMFDIPMGRSFPEKLGNILLGPTGQTITRGIAELQEQKTIGHIGKLESLAKTAYETSPSVKQFIFLAKALDKDTSNLDAKGRQRYELTVTDLWKKAFGFRPMSESLQRAQLDALFDIKEARDKTVDIAAGHQLDGGYAKAQEVIVRYNKMYPEFGISNAELNERRKAREAAKGKSQLERMIEQAPQRIRRGLPAVGIERP